MRGLNTLVSAIAIAVWGGGWPAAASCPAFTNLDDTLLTPPPQVTASENPDHHREWVYQEFPSSDLQNVNSVSSWSIHVVQRSIDGLGDNRIIAIEEAIYTTSEGKSIHVLGGLWPQQIFVPYAQSTDVIQDLGQGQPLMQLTERDASLAPCGALGPDIYPRDKAAAEFDMAPPESPRAIYVKELRDVGLLAVRFNEDADYEPARPRVIRRGSELVIWAVSDADYYDNVIAYHFRDDGEVMALIGPTGWNTNVGPPNRLMSGNTPHAHTVLWRLQPEIADTGSPDGVSVVRYLQHAEHEGKPNEHFASDLLTAETSFVYDAAEFTRLLVSDPNSFNEAAPGKEPEENGYVLTLISDGTPRHRLWYGDDRSKEPFDFAIIRDRAEERGAQPYHTRLLPNLFKLVNDEPLVGENVAIYAFSTIAHIPRAEDFVVHPDAPDYVEKSPLNLTTVKWSGIRLMPRNIYTRVPFSQPTPGAKATPLAALPLTRACVGLASPPRIDELQCENGEPRASIGLSAVNQNPFGRSAAEIEITGPELVGSPLRLSTHLRYGEAQEIPAESLLVRPAPGQQEICLDITMAGEDWRCPAEPQCITLAEDACAPPD